MGGAGGRIGGGGGGGTGWRAARGQAGYPDLLSQGVTSLTRNFHHCLLTCNPMPRPPDHSVALLAGSAGRMAIWVTEDPAGTLLPAQGGVVGVGLGEGGGEGALPVSETVASRTMPERFCLIQLSMPGAIPIL